MYYNGETIKDSKSSKWGYVISSSFYKDFKQSKIEKEVLNTFDTEDEAKSKLDIVKRTYI